MAIRIGALACVALVVLSSASAAFAQTTTRPAAKPKAKPARTAPAQPVKPKDDQSYLGLDLPDSPGGKPPNYVYQSQTQSVFRGSLVGGDSTLFGGNFGVTNPGLR
jgi:hypothetical protein